MLVLNYVRDGSVTVKAFFETINNPLAWDGGVPKEIILLKHNRGLGAEGKNPGVKLLGTKERKCPQAAQLVVVPSEDLPIDASCLEEVILLAFPGTPTDALEIGMQKVGIVISRKN